MYTVCVRDHFMIAHSFKGEGFGPAQGVHGATYVVDVEIRSGELTGDAVVIDIGFASDALRSVLNELNYRNLDSEPAFSGKNTTTEFLARVIFDRVAKIILSTAGGAPPAHFKSMRVTLHESHIAWASYENELTGRS